MLNQNKPVVQTKKDDAEQDSMEEDIPEGDADEDDYEDDFEESNQKSEEKKVEVKPEIKQPPASKPSIGGNRLASKPNFLMGKPKPAAAEPKDPPAKDFNQMILERQNKLNAQAPAAGSALNQPAAKKEYPWSQASGNKYEEKKYPW